MRAIRTLGTTGSPLSPDVQQWGADQFARVRAEAGCVASAEPPVWWCNMSGGTDFAGAFVGGNRELPQVPGEMQCDATINRHGLRMGTSELYSAVEALPEVLDAMVVDLEYLGRESYMPLFLVLRPGVELDATLKTKINSAIKTALSPRFIPDEIFVAPQIPRTLSGKKQELPIKKLLLGHPLDKVVNPDAMANPESLAWYLALAQRRTRAGAQVAATRPAPQPPFG